MHCHGYLHLNGAICRCHHHHCDDLYTPEDKQILMAAFQKGGNQALCNAVSKMHSKGLPGHHGHGRVMTSTTYGNFRCRTAAVRSAWSRIVPILFGEAWGDTRSMDYNLSALEMDISTEKGKSTGKLLPACQLMVNKKTGELEIETFQNPWNMVGFIDWNKPQ